MYYNGFFGVLKERSGKFEGYIKDIPEDIYYSGATEGKRRRLLDGKWISI